MSSRRIAVVACTAREVVCNERDFVGRRHAADASNVPCAFAGAFDARETRIGCDKDGYRRRPEGRGKMRKPRVDAADQIGTGKKRGECRQLAACKNGCGGVAFREANAPLRFLVVPRDQQHAHPGPSELAHQRTPMRFRPQLVGAAGRVQTYRKPRLLR